MPASLSGLAAVMAGGLSSTASGAQRALGEKSYLLITSDYMNLNSRLAYHFTLVDACVSDTSVNYIFFRFAGGAATQWRRNLRACFVEICLTRYGFHVDRRGDLVNAWFKNAAADDTAARLDIIGRLMACTSQLDMYMTSDEVMNWYVQQFMTGNYAFIGTDADGMEAGTGSVDI
jgi:pyruvate,water dikinase